MKINIIANSISLLTFCGLETGTFFEFLIAIALADTAKNLLQCRWNLQLVAPMDTVKDFFGIGHQRTSPQGVRGILHIGKVNAV